ncbi:MAG: Gfo/Idh/MocA family oxidoreductase [Armatimonadetes bacterium]|nr:Gfo/Idh/MocA family oxidoreductase [Armatimonadota bacterium]
MTRRGFLDEAFFAAAIASLTASGAFATEPEPSRPRRRYGAADKVRMAVIGVHGRGMAHVDGYLGQPDAEIVAICDVDLSSAEKAAAAIEKKTGKKPKIYQDLRKVFEDKEIDAVSCALPIHWHALAASWAMQAGKDVYVEKPCSHNVSEGRRLVQLQQRTGRICQVGTQSRSAKAVQQGIKFLHDGKLGKVTMARGLCYKPRKSIGIKPDGPVPAGVDYDIWLGPAPKRPFNPNRFHYEWHWNFDYGAGDLGNQGIHQMDIARWALGKHELPLGVETIGCRLGYVDQANTPNTVVSTYDYGDKQLIFEVRGLPTEKFMGADIGDIVYGENGYVVFTSSYGKAAAFDKEGKPLETFSGGGDHFAAFIKAVKSRQQSDLAAPVLEGHLSSALCHLGNVSYRLGKEGDPAKSNFENKPFGEAYSRMMQHLTANNALTPDAKLRFGASLKFDPKKERFVGAGDSEANKLLTREYRKGFELPKA